MLKNLTKLTEVELIGNQTKDVTPLSEFKNLERLALTGNPIENIQLLSHIGNLEFDN